MGANDPYFAPAGTWEANGIGTDMYQLETYCPYCGSAKRDELKRIQGVWFWLKCRSCGRDYKVRSKAK